MNKSSFTTQFFLYIAIMTGFYQMIISNDPPKQINSQDALLFFTYPYRYKKYLYNKLLKKEGFAFFDIPFETIANADDKTLIKVPTRLYLPLKQKAEYNKNLWHKGIFWLYGADVLRLTGWYNPHSFKAHKIPAYLDTFTSITKKELVLLLPFLQYVENKKESSMYYFLLNEKEDSFLVEGELARIISSYRSLAEAPAYKF
ncbi:MAG: hypothetical protein WA432_02965 [Candidatus Babeliaceae bacterium]